VQRFVAYDETSGEPIASAGLTTYPDLEFGFLWAGATVPHARGRGAYSALVAARVQRAGELGLKSAGLYAKLDTSAPIVSKQGFARYGRMIYWQRDGQHRALNRPSWAVVYTHDWIDQVLRTVSTNAEVEVPKAMCAPRPRSRC
jgi:hypothetical protein